MVLTDLGRKISTALDSLTKTTVINEEVFKSVLDQISTSLLEAGVNPRLIETLKGNITDGLNFHGMANGCVKKITIKNRVVKELINLMDPKVRAQKPVKKKSNVVMLFGLQSSGITTSCLKLAKYYSEKKWKVGVICVDAVGTKSYDHLKEKIGSTNIHLHNNHTEADPVVTAQEGIEMFRNKSFDIIIVDTNGRLDEDTLFREMLQFSDAIKPDHIMFVIDAKTGEVCEDQVKTFKEKFNNASVIVTKLDLHSNGAATLSSVASTNIPIAFIGTGEGLDYIELFAARHFVRQILGMGDMKNFIKKINTNASVIPMYQTGYTLRDLYNLYLVLEKVGPLSRAMRMFPGISNDYSEVKDQEYRIYVDVGLTVLSGMNDEELDHSDGAKLFHEENDRITRVANATGASKEDIESVLSEYTELRFDCETVESIYKGAANRKLNRAERAALVRHTEEMCSNSHSFLKKIEQSGGVANVLYKIERSTASVIAEKKRKLEKISRKKESVQKKKKKMKFNNETTVIENLRTLNL